MAAEVQPLAGELDILDNRMEGTSITIEPAPEIAIEAITPEARILKEGETLRVQVKIRNRAPIQQVFDLELLWKDQIIATNKINLAGRSMKIEVISWITDVVGEGRIRVRTSPIPYEANPLDNDLAAGLITIMPPNVPPEARASGPAISLSGLTATFNASGSMDPDGELAGYSWDIDGEVSTGMIVQHAFMTPGTYQVNLTVTDDDGKSSSNLTLIEILDPAAFLFWASDERGGMIGEISPGVKVYASTISPGPYNCTLYVITSGTASPGFELIDVTGDPLNIGMDGTTITPVWTPISDGIYDMVLDLDQNGIFSPEYDEIHASVKVVNQAISFIGFTLVTIILHRGRLGGDPP